MNLTKTTMTFKVVWFTDDEEEQRKTCLFCAILDHEDDVGGGGDDDDDTRYIFCSQVLFIFILWSTVSLWLFLQQLDELFACSSGKPFSIVKKNKFKTFLQPILLTHCLHKYFMLYHFLQHSVHEDRHQFQHVFLWFAVVRSNDFNFLRAFVRQQLADYLLP